MRDPQTQALAEALADPRRVAAALGLRAVKQARGVLVCCPVHGDKAPSLSLTLGADRTLRVRCFGCGVRGDVFSLMKALHKCSWPEAFAHAAALAGTEAPTLQPYEDDAPPLDDATFRDLARWLLRAPMPDAVRRYLAGRHVLEQALADGWTGLPGYREQDATVAAAIDRYGLDALERSGMFVRDLDSGALRFSRPGARVLIPWRDAAGQLLSIQRRRIDDGETPYAAPRGRPLVVPYGVDELAAHPEAAVAYVEGAVDVMALRERLTRRGLHAVILGVPGVETWRPAWAAYAAGREAYVALDADKAGDGMAPRVADDLRAAGAVRVGRWRPGRKDWAAGLLNEG